MMILEFLVIGFLVYYAITSKNNNKNAHSQRRKTPEEIVKERFVMGEIDEETYFQMIETLKK